MDKKLIEKIQKILAKTVDGSGASEAEIATAMRIAQRLLMQHDLNISQFQEKYSADNEVEIEDVVTKSVYVAGRTNLWECRLGEAVAILFNCKFIWVAPQRLKMPSGSTKRIVHFIFIGCETDVAVASSMLKSLIDAGKVRRRLAVDLLPDVYNRSEKNIYGRNFLIGFSERILERCKDMKSNKLENLVPGSNSIVVYQNILAKKDSAIQKAVEAQYSTHGKGTSKISKHTKDGSGRQAGRNSGNAIHLGAKAISKSEF